MANVGISTEAIERSQQTTTPTTPTPPSTTTTPVVSPRNPVGNSTTITPGQVDANNPNDINVVDYASQVVTDPNLFFRGDNPNTVGTNESGFLADHMSSQTMTGTEAGTNINANDPRFYMHSASLNQTADTTTEQANRQSETYDVANTLPQVQNQDMTGAQGTVNQQSLIDANKVQTDLNAETASGTALGDALNKRAYQDIKEVVDTSTLEGKQRAEVLGKFNYVDDKATVRGQLDKLQSDFFDKDGNPTIPAWASAQARNVSKIASFSGMTGTAAAAAMSQALLEASLPIAQEDAKFFQTVTLQNLNNEQEATINNANILSKMSMQNADARLATAIENSKSFMAMDLKNLDNDQQAAVINNQNRVQSILEDAKQENVKRRFVAESDNELNKFYDQMNSQIRMFNSTQTNDMSKFNADMENSRESFYKSMQFNIDSSNAKWRQTVTMTEDQQKYDAVATDIKNKFQIGAEQLNRIWDRSDSLLDYLWKSAESKADRDTQLLIQKIDNKQKDSAGLGSLLGSLAGTAAESFFSNFKWGF